MSRNYRNWKPSSIGPNTVLRTRAYGLDLDWTAGGRCNGKYVYALRTLELVPGTTQVAIQGTTHDVAEVRYTEQGEWGAYLYGELMGTASYKGGAQALIEELVTV